MSVDDTNQYFTPMRDATGKLQAMRFVPVDDEDQYFIPMRDAAGKLNALRVTPVDDEDQYAFPVRDASGKLVMVKGGSIGPYLEVTVNDTDVWREETFTLTITAKNADGTTNTSEYGSVTISLTGDPDPSDGVYVYDALTTTISLNAGVKATTVNLQGGSGTDTCKILGVLEDYADGTSEEITVKGDRYYWVIADGPDAGDWYNGKALAKMSTKYPAPFPTRNYYWNSARVSPFTGTDPLTELQYWGFTTSGRGNFAYRVQVNASIKASSEDLDDSLNIGSNGVGGNYLACGNGFIMDSAFEKTINKLVVNIDGWTGAAVDQTVRMRIYKGQGVSSMDTDTLIAKNDSVTLTHNVTGWITNTLTNVAP